MLVTKYFLLVFFFFLAKPIEHSDSDSDGLVFDRTPYIPPVRRPPWSKAVKQPVIPVAKKSHFCQEVYQVTLVS